MAKRKVFKTTRKDGRFVSTAGFLHHSLKRLKPELAFNPAFRRDQFLAWRKSVRRKLRELLALPRAISQPKPRKVSERQRDGYVLQRWEIYPEPRCVVPVLLLVPDKASKAAPAPAVLCLPGTDHRKEVLAGEEGMGPVFKNTWGDCQQMAKHFARHRCVALAMDNPSTAELFDPVDPGWCRQSHQLIWMGRSYEGLSVFQKLAALDWLKTLPFVDGRRIAACGHSLGAKPALHLGILEPVVRAVVWNDNAADWRVREVVRNLAPVAPWHYIPGFVRWFDYIDLMAALAPKPLLVSEGGRGEDLQRIRAAYRIAGAPDHFKVTYMPNFADPAKRKYDGKKIPEGVDSDTYIRYTHCDGAHYFKADVAVPWLCHVFGMECPSQA